MCHQAPSLPQCVQHLTPRAAGLVWPQGPSTRASCLLRRLVTLTLSRPTLALAAAAIGLLQGTSPVHAKEERPDGHNSAGTEQGPGHRTSVMQPKLLYATPPTYPPAARGSAEVAARVLVGTIGEVREVEIEQGQSPFSEAAAAALLGYIFTPAMVAGEPRAAWVSVLVRFRPSQVPSDTAEADEVRAPDDQPVQTDANVVEVLVQGERIVTDSVSLDSEALRQLPGAMGDPFRALEALPGVTPMISGLPYFFVRGAPPGNVGYFLEGVRIPLLFHMGAGPGVLPADLIDGVRLYPAAYPARMGRFSGGIVEATLRPPRQEPWMTATLRVTDAGLVAESPIIDDKTTALVGGRYSYVGPIIRLFAPEINLQYWDYQARLARQLNTHDSVRWFAFGSNDSFGNDGAVLSSQFHRLDFEFRRTHSPRSKTTVGATIGQDETSDDSSLGAVRNRSLVVRTEHSAPWADTLDAVAGSNVRLDDYNVLREQGLPAETDDRNILTDPTRFRSAYKTRLDGVLSAYGELYWQATKSVSVTPGIRGDLYFSGGEAAVAIEPRVTSDYVINEALSLHHGVGLAHEPPSFPVPVPGLQLANLEDGLQQSVQSSFGAGYKLPAGIRTKATLFHNVFFNSTDAPGLSNVPVDYDVDQRTIGQAYGVELLVERSFSRRLGGMLAYTLSRNTRTVGRFKDAAAWDRTHVVNAALGYRWGSGIRTGARVVFYTGRPPDLIPPPGSSGGGGGGLAAIAREDPAIAETVDRLRDTTNSTPTTARRTTPFYRLDLRAEKRWTLSERRWFAVVFEVINATLNPEEFDLDCSVVGCTADQLGPLTIPNLSLEAGF